MALKKKATRQYKAKWFDKQDKEVHPALSKTSVLARSVEEARDELFSLFFNFRHSVNIGKVRDFAGNARAARVEISRTYEEEGYYNAVVEKDSHMFGYPLPDIHAETFDPR